MTPPIDARKPARPAPPGSSAPSATSQIILAAWPYLASALLASIIAASVLHLGQHDWSLPLQYHGWDLFFYLTCSKTIRQTGWFFGNPLLGAPVGLSMLDYPLCDDLNLLAIKLCNAVTSDFVTALNLYYFLGFPLAALTATAAFRKLKISRPASAAAATLFALAPYHFFRMQHTFLAFYIMLPPALAIAIRIADGEEFPFTNPATRRKSLFVLLILLATVSTGIYYSFFVAVFIAIAGVLAAVRFRNWRRLIAPALFLCVILIGFVINTAPNLYQLATAPPNPDAVKRYSGESEVYALRLTNLLLPVLDDRIPALAAMTRRYEATVPYSESSTAGVGLLTDVGILILLAVALAACAGIPAPRPLGALAALMLAGILLGTFGGFGPLFAFLVSPLLRSWGRISICLAFFSLCALAMLADSFVFLQPARAKNKALLAALLILFSVGVWEQIPWIDINEQDIAKHWRWDDNFVRLIEARVGRDATIFQLPYVPFPEGPLVGHMADYDLFRGYFHSDTLAWSYGSMRGRDGDKWQEAVASLPVPQMLSKLRDAKFDGIYFDRFGDLPNTADLLNQLQSACGPPVVSEDPDHRLLFFSLKPLQP